MLKNLSFENHRRYYYFIFFCFFLGIVSQINYYNLIILIFLISIMVIPKNIFNSKILKKINIIFFVIIIITPSIYFTNYSQKLFKTISIKFSELTIQDFVKDETHNNCSENFKINKVAEYFFLNRGDESFARERKYLDQKKLYKEPYLEYCNNGVLYWSYVGFLRRIDQVNSLFDDNVSLKDLLVGFNKEKISNNNIRGLFTHNSYLNLITRYGLISYIIFIILIFNILKKENNKKNILFCFLIFLFFKNFDDYLFANRLEISMLFWFLFFALIKKDNLKLN